MKNPRASLSSVVVLGFFSIAAGCASVPAERGSATMSVGCPTSADVPNARYVGPYRGVENNLTA